MYKVCTHRKISTLFRQLGLLGLCLLSLSMKSLNSQSKGRMPASYIPDDDMIVKPVNNEISFYQRYVKSDSSDEVVESRNQLKVWSDNQNFADQHGLDTTLTGSSFFVPTPEEKWEYFKDRYMRYLRGRSERPFKDMPKNWYKEYRASNEVDTINELEGKFRETNKNSTVEKNLPQALRAKEVSLWKRNRIIFQPRLDQGLVIVGFKGPLGHARAWVGYNGRTEVNYKKTFDSMGLFMMFNYYTDTGKYFTSVDKHIYDNLYARFVSSKDPTHEPGRPYQDDTLMLHYSMQF